MKYELTTIVPETVTTNPAIALVATHGGSITREDELGVRRLAYPIKQHTNGVYTRFGLELDPAQVQPLDAVLRRTSDIIRHLIVLQPREDLAPAPHKVEMSDEQIAALGDVKEMQAAEEKAKTAIEVEQSTEQSVAVIEENEAPETVEVAVETAEQQPAEDVTAGEHAAVKDESGVDEATRKAALDKKLESILGK